MLRYSLTRTGAGLYTLPRVYKPYGRFTVKPAPSSAELAEAHFQTKRGQLRAAGKEVPPNKPEDLERVEYGNAS